MEFNTPLYALFALVAAILWTVAYWRIFKKPQLVLPDKYLVKSQFGIRCLVYIVGILAWGFIGVALMQPRVPTGNVKNTIEVNDIYFVVDASGSMTAEDFKPNRMEVAKKKILEFVELKPTDRMGIVVFGTKPFTLMPLTIDHDLIKLVVKDIHPSLPGLGPGTNIGDALALAAGRAANSMAKNKVIILLTDGAASAGILSPLDAAEQVKKQGIKIYTIGIGSKGDTYMYARDRFGRRVRQSIPGGGYEGEVLEKIAEITGGKSFTASSEEGLKSVLSEINALEKSKIESFGRIIYDELYHFYLLVGVLLFIATELFRRFIIREGA